MVSRSTTSRSSKPAITRSLSSSHPIPPAPTTSSRAPRTRAYSSGPSTASRALSAAVGSIVMFLGLGSAGVRTRTHHEARVRW